jgi:HEAT repeat protein
MLRCLPMSLRRPPCVLLLLALAVAATYSSECGAQNVDLAPRPLEGLLKIPDDRKPQDVSKRHEQSLQEKAQKEYPEPEKFLDELIAGLNGENRQWHAEALRHFTIRFKSVVEGRLLELAKRLSEETDELTIEKLSFALELLGPKLEPALPYLKLMLEKNQVEIRGHAAQLLREIGEPAMVVAPLLLRDLDAESDLIRSRMAAAICSIGTSKLSASEAADLAARAPKLSESVKFWHGWLEPLIYEKLIVGHPDMADALLPKLRGLIARANKNLQRGALLAVRRLLPAYLEKIREFVQEIQRCLSSEDRDVTSEAVQLVLVLADLNVDVPKETVAALVAALHDSKRAEIALFGLAKLGSKSATANPEILKLLGHEDDWIRRQAALALALTGQGSKEVVSALDARLADDDEDVRRAVCYALQILVPALDEFPESIVASVTKQLKDTDKYVRERAVIALGSWGAKAESAEQALIQVQDDKVDFVALAATNALEAIRK